jgi:DNA-directed RNA polymerase
MPIVYDAVNSIQNTAWKVNTDVMAVLEALWERGHPVAGLPSRDDIEATPCPSCGQSIPLPKLNSRGYTEHTCFEDPAVMRKWKQSAFECHSINVSLQSKRLAVAKTLRIATACADADAIYFPYQLDFRGRIYAIPSFNPQGNDVTKGLLTFAKSMPINDGLSAGWLAIHGANVWGYDKASLEDRIGWVEENQDKIIASASDPLGQTWWHGADKPWQFLAFCFEWAGFCEEGYGYMSSLPVALDGSCSGIQHFSAMLLDQEGGRAVNLLPAKTPADIYQAVCDRVVFKLRNVANELGSTIAEAISPTPTKGGKKTEAITVATVEAIAEADGWSDPLIALGWLAMQPDRKMTKRQVMTLPYGSTIYSCRTYTTEWYKDKVEELGVDPFKSDMGFTAANYLSGLIWDAIKEVVNGSRTAMDWLQQCAKIVASEQLPVYWTTPVGFIVMQQYKNMLSRRVKTKLGDSVIKLSLQEEQDTIDKRRMANAISPNFVHSMDATHLMMSVCYATDNGVSDFAVIHDSFGTHAANVNMLGACLREAFVDLYSETDVLSDFREQIIRQVDPEHAGDVPPVPEKGTLDLNEVRGSDFFFA